MSVQLGQVDLVNQLQSAAATAGGFSDISSQISQAGGTLLNQLTSGVPSFGIPGADLLTPNITNLNLNEASDELNQLLNFLSVIKDKITNLLTPNISFAPSLRLPVGETQLLLAAELQSITTKIAAVLALYALIQSLKSSGSNKTVAQALAEQDAQANTTSTNNLISSTTTEFFNTSVT